MKAKLTLPTRLFGAILSAGVLATLTVTAQPFGQWDFNNSNLVATAGADLAYADGSGGTTASATKFGSTAAFGIPSINGTNAIVMRFPAANGGLGYNMPTPGVNGRGFLVDNYTLILDLLYPAVSDHQYRPLLETDGDLIVPGAGADIAVGTGNGIGLTGGTFDGAINPNTWYRIGLVVRTNEVRTYINGAQVGQQTAQADRLPLGPNSVTLLLANLGANPAATGYVNSVQLRDLALTSDQMTAFGGPSADGIPPAIPSIPSFVQSWIPAGAASSTITDLKAVINPGDASVDTNSIILKLNNVAQTGVTIASNGLITVLKSAVGPLTPGTTYTVAVSFTDSQAGAKTFSKQFKAALLSEDFEELTLGTNIDEGWLVELPTGGPTTYSNVWTRTPPAGWVLDDSAMPGFGVITNDGVSEWAGWSFASKTFWGVKTDNQNRQLFTYGQGTVAVADPDEWDDAAHPQFDTNGNALYFNSFLTTRPINIAGLPPNSVFMNFDSSWRPEGGDDWGGTNDQTAVITVSYNGGAPIQVLRWNSLAGPNFHPEAENEKVSLLLNNPAGATNLVVKFGLIKAANDWWWAFDNLEINIGDIPSGILQYVPSQNATNVGPQPALGATIAPGTTTINPASIQLKLDGTAIAVTVTTNVQGQLVVSGTAPSILPNNTVHTNSLVYVDSLSGTLSTNWVFTVSYNQITRGIPVWFENFDGIAEAALPTGWTATNLTTVLNTNLDLNDPESASYENFVVVSTNRLGSVFNNRRFNVRPATLNGQVVTSLMSGNIAYAESDNRGGNQVQVLFSPAINLTGISNVQLMFNSIYEQNQDSLGAVEYSIDDGGTWLPLLYMIEQADVIAGDPVATLGTARSDQAYGLGYGAFIGATVDPSFGPYISGRIDDDPTESKQIEVFSLPQAANQTNVRLRFLQTGTGSWYFGLDDVGIYGSGATNVPVQIVNQPQSKTVFVAQPSSLTVGISPYSTRPLTFQWLKNGTNAPGGTSQIYSIANPQLADAGDYSVIVSNVRGSVTSAVATVTIVNPLPAISNQPVSRFVSAGTPVSFSVAATTPVGTLSYQWFKDGGALSGETSATLSIASAQIANQGAYYVAVSNQAGSTNSVSAQLVVFGGSLGDNLVAYLPFDGNYKDYSVYHNNGTPVGSPSFAAGRVGQSLHFTTTNDESVLNYVTLGYPSSLQFGANSFSVGFWINYTNQGDDPAFISNKDWNSSNNHGWGLFSQGNGRFRVNATGTGGTKMDTSSTPIVRDGNWHQILCTFWRDQFVSTYVDGQLIITSPALFTGSVDTVTNGFSVNIGQDGTGHYTDNHDSSLHIDGFIDEVMLWNRVVTPTEVALLYNSGTNGLSPLPVITSLSRSGNSVTINWVGGLPPFTLESKAQLNAPGWTTFGTTPNHSFTGSISGNVGFLRIRGSNQ